MVGAKVFIAICTLLTVVIAADNKVRVQTKCGLPSFIDKLPADAKQKVEDVWANYTEGHNCKKELKLQRAIVGSLSNSTKEILFEESDTFTREPPICGLPHFIDELPAETQKKLRSIWTDFEDGVECEDMQNATKNLIDALPVDIRQKLAENKKIMVAVAKSAPEFLKNLDQKTRQKFHEIFLNKELTKSARRAALKKLADSVLTPDQLRLFYKYEAIRDSRTRSRIDGAKTNKGSAKATTAEPKKVAEQLSTAASTSSTVEKSQKGGQKNSTLSNDAKSSPKEDNSHQENGSPPQQVAPRCGLPPFHKKLPSDAQEKLSAIWANYAKGNTCIKERKATRELIKTLPKDVRLSLRSKKTQARQS